MSTDLGDYTNMLRKAGVTWQEDIKAEMKIEDWPTGLDWDVAVIVGTIRGSEIQRGYGGFVSYHFFLKGSLVGTGVWE